MAARARGPLVSHKRFMEDIIDLPCSPALYEQLCRTHYIDVSVLIFDGRWSEAHTKKRPTNLAKLTNKQPNCSARLTDEEIKR